MASIFSPGLLVPGPAVVPNSYGLLSVVDPVMPSDVHWEGGISWEDTLCSEMHSTLPSCPAPVATKSTERDLEFCEATPFTVYAYSDCSVGGRSVEQAFEIAKARLLINEHKAVEEIFWTGVTEAGPVTPSLQAGNLTCGAAPSDLTPESGALDPVAAMAVLDSALGVCVPGSGVLHANYGLVNYFAHHSLITERGGRYYSPTGQRLAMGAGYPGTGPANAAAVAGTTWMFGTGPIAIWRSEVFMTPNSVAEAVDRRLNDVTVFAERVYAVGWSCCLYAVLVSLRCV